MDTTEIQPEDQIKPVLRSPIDGPLVSYGDVIVFPAVQYDCNIRRDSSFNPVTSIDNQLKLPTDSTVEILASSDAYPEVYDATTSSQR